MPPTKLDVSLNEVFRGPENDRGGFELNVVLVPEIDSRVGLNWAVGQGEPWPSSFFTSITKHVRIFEFIYQLDVRSSTSFSWTILLETGRRLFDELCNPEHELGKCPFLMVGHGLGGILIKQAIVLLDEGYYDPTCRELSFYLAASLLLGTPHPHFGDRLDASLCSIKSMPKSRLEKIHEEVPVLYMLSNKFENIVSERPIWSAFEKRATRYSTTSMFKTKKEVIVNQDLATTGLTSEQVVEIDEDHFTIAQLSTNARVLGAVKANITSVLTLQRAMQRDPRTDTVATARARELWGSVTTESVSPAQDSTQDIPLRPAPSPAGATAGSQDVSSYEIVPSIHHGLVSDIPEIKLPCRLLGPDVGECFDRNEIFELLNEKLLPSSETSKSKMDVIRTFSISGPGGIGKTQIARNFVARNASRFDAVFWVNAETESKLASAFNTISAELNLLDPADYGNSVVSRNRVVNWLSNPYRTSSLESETKSGNLPPDQETAINWLLVFDNADELNLLAEYWPVTGTGSVLITSRDPQAKRYMWAGSGIDLEGFDKDHAIEFLRSMGAKDQDDQVIDKTAAARVSERLGGLPFPLILAANLIQQNELSVDEFLEYHEEPSFFAHIYGSTEVGEPSDASSRRTLYDIWSFDKIQRSCPQAICLIEVLSLLDPDAVSETILAASKPVVDILADYPSSPEEYDTARNLLIKSSLIKRDMNRKILSIHRLVQDAVRARMPEARLQVIFQGLIHLLRQAWPSGSHTRNHDTTRWGQCNLVFPHLERIKDHLSKLVDLTLPIGDQLYLSKLLIDAGWHHLERGNYEQTVGFVKQALAIAEKADSVDALQVQATAHFCLAAASTWLRDTDLTEYHSGKCLSIRRDLTPSGTSLLLAMAYDEAAHYQLLKGDFATGLDLENKAIEILEDLENEKGDFDPAEKNAGSYAGSFIRYCAAISLLKMGKVDEAESAIMALWKRQEEFWPLVNKVVFKTGLTLSVVGSIRLAQGRFAESYELHEKSLLQFRQTVGNLHPHTASALVRVADHLIRLGLLDEARDRLEEAIGIWKSRPSFVPELARATHKQSKLQMLLGNSIKAKGTQLKAQSQLKSFARDKNLSLPATLGDEDFDALVSFWAWY
ncbi:hypothetical protein FDECE_9488 [Fusarium decemcellulare]|nr:hypothetical protein FDECE_9488 [Fusarium decemcellulare]